MSQPSRRFCATPGCANRVTKGHCPGHSRLREAGRYNADMRHLYASARWRTLRAQVLQDAPLCRECRIEGRVEPSTDVDHIVPHRGDESLFWLRANLVGLCHTCHSRKTQRGE